MGLPTSPVTLSVAQIDALNRHLCTLRHDINNHLSLVVAAAELIKVNQEVIPRMLPTLAEQPSRITDLLNKFTSEFEKSLGILRKD